MRWSFDIIIKMIVMNGLGTTLSVIGNDYFSS